MEKKKIYLSVIIFLVILALGSLFQLNKKSGNPEVLSQSQTNIKAADIFRYPGKDGKDALTLLMERTQARQDSSGMVVEISNRKAEASKHEYWAFYVNGKLSSVGPGDYKTKDNDNIEWRIEKY